MGYSWIVYCLPFLEEQEVADRILKQGKSIAPPIAVLFCPSDTIVTGGASDKHEGSYFGSGGAGKDPKLRDRLGRQALRRYLHRRGLLIPIARPTPATSPMGSLTRWRSANDRMRNMSGPLGRIGSAAPTNGIAPCRRKTCAGRSTRPLPRPVTSCRIPAAAAELRTMHTNDLYFGSKHPGGAWFAFAGGNVGIHCRRHRVQRLSRPGLAQWRRAVAIIPRLGRRPGAVLPICSAGGAGNDDDGPCVNHGRLLVNSQAAS